MLRLILNRLVGLVLVLLFLTAVLFLLNQASSSDPAKQILGANATPQALQAERHKLWLDRPVTSQYIHYISNLLHGDLGVSTRTQRPVSEDLSRYVLPSVELAVLAITVAVLLGLLLGLLSGIRSRGASLVDNTLIAFGSVPSFLLALVGVIVFYGHLFWLPASGQTDIFDAPSGPTHVVLIDAILAGRFDVVPDAIKHLVLPVLVLAVGPAVAIGRVFRSSLSASMESDYVRTARSKGITESRIVRRHAVRASSGPGLAMLGLQLGGMFAALAVIEVIFGWPGIGSYVAQSIPSGDFPGVAGVTLVVGTAYVVVNTIVDLVQAWADPRVRV
jgi:peptide/nickel transport system permease protein